MLVCSHAWFEVTPLQGHGFLVGSQCMRGRRGSAIGRLSLCPIRNKVPLPSSSSPLFYCCQNLDQAKDPEQNFLFPVLTFQQLLVRCVGESARQKALTNPSLSRKISFEYHQEFLQRSNKLTVANNMKSNHWIMTSPPPKGYTRASN